MSKNIYTTAISRIAATIVCILLCLTAEAREYAASSVLADGKWVKISIKEEGMQVLTPTALRGMGFSDPSKVHVYGYGGYRLSESRLQDQPDDLPIQPVVRLSDGSIVFFGAGLVNWEANNSRFGYQHINNFYATQSYYFLSDRDATDPTPEAYNTSISASAEPVTTFTQLLVHENDLAAPSNTGADLLGEDFRATPQRVFSFPVTDPAGSEISYNVVMGLRFSGASAQVTLSADGKTLTTGNYAPVAMSMSETVATFKRLRTTAPISGTGNAELTIRFSGGGVTQLARLDYIMASYQRHLKLNAGLLQFTHNSRQAEVLQVSGCSSSTRIWDVTDPANPRPVTFTLSGTTARFAPTGTGLRTYVAFNPDAVKSTPTAAGSVSNQNLHAMPVPNMVIICPKEYMVQAERLADFHRQVDGMTVHVLTPEDIYNEFASGKPDATAFRKMLKMYYDRGVAQPSGTQLEHCLLFGRPSYDHRLISDTPKLSNYPRLLTWESYVNIANVDSYTLSDSYSYCSDNYFAALEDETSNFNFNTTRMSIGVGRLPVKSLAEAKTSVDKIINYVSNPDLGAWRSNVLLVADDADNGAHLRQMELLHTGLMNTGNGGDFICERLYLDSYPIGTGGNSKEFPQAKDRMFKLLDEGVNFMAYIGHANPTSWTHENLMTYSDITSLSYRHLPVIFHVSCEFVRFDDDAESGAETMWLNPTSGAIAFIAANRKVYIGQNEYTATPFGRSYFEKDADGNPLPLGTVWRNTLNRVNNSPDAGQKNRFALMGDPALRVASPARSLKVESIAGTSMEQATATGNLPVVPACSQMKVSGCVRLASGDIDADFNGRITTTLFDAERVIETYGHPSENGKDDGKVMMYNDRKNRLATASFPVTNGRWEATLYLPDEIDNNYSPALLALYACSDDGREAIGSTADFYVYGWDDTLPVDTEAPEIEYAALGNLNFRPGDVVGTSTTFLAKVRDNSGINISSAGIGKQMMLILDGKKIYDDLSDYFTTDMEDPTGGTISYPLDDLIEGSHELVFQLFDNAGNSSRATLPFTVGGPGLIPDVDLRTDANPASQAANIYITTATQPQTAILEVFDMAGRCVWSYTPESLSQSMNVTWDLCTNSGTRVPRGIYLYRATIKSADGFEYSRTRKLAVTAE